MATSRRALLVVLLAAALLSGCPDGPVTVAKPVRESEVRKSGKDYIMRRVYADGSVTYGIVGAKEEFVSWGGGVLSYGGILEQSFYNAPAAPAPQTRAPALAPPEAGKPVAPPLMTAPPVDHRPQPDLHPYPSGPAGHYPPSGYRPP